MFQRNKQYKGRNFDNIDKSSVLYQKYLKKHDPQAPENIAKAKKEKSEKRRNWWAQNWIAFLSLILAALALIVAIFSLNFARLSYEATSRVQEVAQCETK